MMIPKKIHLCWLSGDKYPELIMRCIDSWKKYLPDYEIVLWDRHKINMSNIPWVAEAYEAKKYAFAADYIRLYAVYNEGGIYLDSDVEVIGSFDAMLNAKSFIGIERGGDFEAAVIGAQPKCEWLKECLKYYDNRHFVKPDGNYDLCPLPVIVGKVLMDVYKLNRKPMSMLKRMTIRRLWYIRLNISRRNRCILIRYIRLLERLRFTISTVRGQKKVGVTKSRFGYIIV